MTKRCEICYVEGTNRYFIGGLRPGSSYRPPDCQLCPVCQQVAERIVRTQNFFWRAGTLRDTTNSRYSRLKAAVKRMRFGDPNVSMKKPKDEEN